MSKATKIAAKSAKASQKAQTLAKGQKASAAAKSGSKAQNATGNPYRVGGGYWASVEALKSLGCNKLHSHDAIVAAVKAQMIAAKTWKAFTAKDGAEWDSKKRILCNVMVCSRSDYSKPLNAIGYEVRWDGREKVAGLFRTK